MSPTEPESEATEQAGGEVGSTDPPGGALLTSEAEREVSVESAARSESPGPVAKPEAPEAEAAAEAGAPALTDGDDEARTEADDAGGGDEAHAESGATDGGDEADDTDGGDDASTEAAGEATAEGAGGSPSDAPKKKRRRRRKKKPHGAEAGAESQEKSEPQKKSTRPRPHRASDRTPFHVGEEVFGKVTAVLDTAIMVDLAGKALAIFDRSEMEPDDLVPSPGDRFVARIHNDGGRGGLVVLTRKPLREEETKPLIEQAHKAGEHVSGLITGVIKGGVEVDIGGVRAFAPASGMDLHPQNANFGAIVGQRLDFKVAQYEKAGRDVVVTRRPMLEAEAHERRKHALSLLEPGQVAPAVVRTVVEWGVFVALPEAENVEGLVHVSEASHDPHAHLSELFKPGDRFEVKILEIDDRGKIWLSRKALIEDPWGVARKQFAPGTRHKGRVVRLERFGAFVELESGIDGLLHVSDLSFDRVEHPKDVLSEGQEIEVTVQYFDSRSKKIGLHLAPPPERANEAPQRIAKNALVKAEVVKGESAGLVVRLLGVTGRAARGFVPAGQTGTPRGTDLRRTFKVGTVIDVKVIDVDQRSGEPRLSIRGYKEDEERRAHREYRDKLKAEGGFGTLGDLLREKMRPSNSAPEEAPKTDESGP